MMCEFYPTTRLHCKLLVIIRILSKFNGPIIYTDSLKSIHNITLLHGDKKYFPRCIFWKNLVLNTLYY